MKTATSYKYECDGCRAVAHGDNLPEGWKRIKKKDYCPKCAKIRDRKLVAKYPAQYIVHTPSGRLFACNRHAKMAGNLYGVLGAHTVAELAMEGVACINCINEKEDENDN